MASTRRPGGKVVVVSTLPSHCAAVPTNVGGMSGKVRGSDKAKTGREASRKSNSYSGKVRLPRLAEDPKLITG